MSEARSEVSGDALRVRQQEFSEEVFHEHLLNFIIADDQVRLYLLCFLQPPRSCLLIPNPQVLPKMHGLVRTASFGLINGLLSFSCTYYLHRFFTVS